MNVCHVHSTEPGPGPSSVLSGRNEEEEMEEGTESIVENTIKMHNCM